MDSFPTEPHTPGENDAAEPPVASSGNGGSGEGAQSALQRLKELERGHPGTLAAPDEPQS